MATQSLVTQNAIETLTASISGRSIYKPLTTTNATETVSGYFDGRGLARYVLSTADGIESITGNITGRKIENYSLVTADAVETVDADNITGRSLLIKLETALTYENVISKYILGNYSLLGLVELEVSLAPGETIVIDSENFTVTKEGEDITYTHSGDWIDAIDRDTDAVALRIESGTSTLTTSIDYAERYL